MLEALGIDAAAAPLAALGAGVDVGSRWVARADPVAMSVTHDDVRIAARVDDLDAREASDLLARLSAHFADDGLAFAAPRPDAWFVTSERPFELRTTPVDAAVGRPLRDRLPSGADAAPWLRWLTESQMLLHEHALAARASQPVNGLWFSQGGALPPPRDVPRLAVQRSAARAGDVAEGLARLAGHDATPLTTLDELIAANGDAVAVLPPVAAAADVERFDREWLVPAQEALDAMRIARLTIIADGHGVAACWNVARRRWLDRLRRPARFDLPHAR
jgi:hypothetical protein